ncbi:MAG: hypothetical protein AVDCRST_MAG44-116 [uncultured Sphingomonas sp.]|uniref:KTSC domain-containing protein n=1 Tax=uncultured Sphingomonas sp. TaxID=158754 RepID=A0A6J4SDV8_9SPHN|nr:MAG: hypothetical protein AVDCRST_MAG44-116 [uncultured Sphingomonas sp.]
MVSVESEALAEIDYDAAHSIVFVRFLDGDWYRYFGVPPAVHAAFLAAASHGHFFHTHILGRYPYQRDR